MFKKTKKTVRIDLTKDADLDRYDQIINDPLVTVIREINEQKSETSSSKDEDGGSSSTTIKIPLLILTYERRELF